ncbi:MAG: DUF2490 domain-containing protein [Candidatus Latescibacterota bacterium]|nr:MAG: DUF2490 domain-containing protein [Candidatus Latescibacterota bacterium]
MTEQTGRKGRWIPVSAWASVLMTMLVLVVMPGNAECRVADINDFQTWSDITTIYKFNDRWRYDGDQGGRGFASNEEWRILYFRPSVRYVARSWVSLHGGVGNFYTHRDSPGYQFEIRPWIGAKFMWPRPGGFVFSHYFRLEDRYSYSEFRDEWDSAFRARYQLAFKSPKFAIAGIEKFYTGAGFELFKDLSGAIFERFANRGRAAIAGGTHFGDAWRAELHYLYQSSGLFIPEGIRTDDHILRLRLFYVFN